MYRILPEQAVSVNLKPGYTRPFSLQDRQHPMSPSGLVGSYPAFSPLSAKNADGCFLFCLHTLAGISLSEVQCSELPGLSSSVKTGSDKTAYWHCKDTHILSFRVL